MAQPAMNGLKAAQYLLDINAVSYDGQNTETECKKTGSHSKVQQDLRGDTLTILTSELAVSVKTVNNTTNYLL